MPRVARWCLHHRRVVLLLWLVALVAAVGLDLSAGSHYQNQFSLPGTQSQQAVDLLRASFPAQAGESDTLVLHARSGTLRDPDVRGQATAVLTAVARLPYVRTVLSPFAAGATQVSRDGTIGFATVVLTGQADQVPVPAVRRLISTAQAGDGPRLQVELSGNAVGNTQRSGTSASEGIGVPAAAVILFVAFGSLFAMLLPLLTTMLALGVGFLGPKVLSRRERRRLATRGPAPEQTSGGWFRWSVFVQRHPVVLAAGAGLVMVVLALPVFSLRLGSSDHGNDPAGLTTRRAYDLLATGFGPGFTGPLQLAAELRSPSDLAALGRVSAAVRAQPGVVRVTPPRVSPAGTAATVLVYPSTSPQDARTSSLLHRLRGTVVPRAEAGCTLVVHVGGATATFDDFARVLSGKLPLFVGVVVLLAFLLLMAVFRSLLVPLVASVMNLLSVGASFGIVVAVFQWGWGRTLVGIGRTGPVEAFLPVLLFSILFGLSMDYEVFLVSRMHEEWVNRGDNEAAVTLGQAETGRVINAAATIMILVFASFVFGGERVIKLFGLGLAFAVFVDAFVVRTVLVPALMHLLGRWNWWLPRGLDRVPPQVSAEAPAVRRGPSQPREPVGARG